MLALALVLRERRCRRRRRTPRASTSRTTTGDRVDAGRDRVLHVRVRKATEGTTLIDPTYSINRAGAEAVGLRVRRATTSRARPAPATPASIANAIAQADYFLDVAQPQAGELPPVLDLETKGGLAPAALQTWTSAWLDEIAARTGVRPSSTRRRTSGRPRSATRTRRGGRAPALGRALDDERVAARSRRELGRPRLDVLAVERLPRPCPASRTAVDGDRFNGTDPAAVAIRTLSGGPPAAGAPPTIVGTPQAGKTLAAVPGALERRQAGHLRLPVAALRRRRRRLRADRRRDGGDVHRRSPPTSATRSRLGHGDRRRTAPRPPARRRPSPSRRRGLDRHAAAVATAPPSVAGTAQAGQTLTARSARGRARRPSFAYEWRRCDAAGAQCTAIVGATAASYTLTPGDIGATISLVVTATGKGGSTSAAAPTTPVVAAAPVPAPPAGSAVAAPGAAGAVSTADGAATVTWQPGAFPRARRSR